MFVNIKLLNCTEHDHDFISDSVIGVTVDLDLQTKSGSEYFCENDVVKLVCNVQNSTILQWKSNDFIGTHESIFFTNEDKVQTAKIKPQAHAFLVRNEPYSSHIINDRRRNISSVLYVQVQNSIGRGARQIECLSSDHTIKQTKEIKISGIIIAFVHNYYHNNNYYSIRLFLLSYYN
jgi:hypothetical protein